MPTKKPRIQPTITSIGECPWTSFRFLYSWTSPWSFKRFPILLIIFAWIPFALLTPTASRTVTIKKQKERTNSPESNPSVIPMQVQRQATRALWLEGIPPVRHIRSSTSSFMLWTFPAKSFMSVFKNWARNQLETQARNIGEDKRVWNCSHTPLNIHIILSVCAFLSSYLGVLCRHFILSLYKFCFEKLNFL